MYRYIHTHVFDNKPKRHTQIAARLKSQFLDYAKKQKQT